MAVGFAPLSAMTGMEVAAIIAAYIGLTLLLAVYKDYEEVSYSNGVVIEEEKLISITL